MRRLLPLLASLVLLALPSAAHGLHVLRMGLRRRSDRDRPAGERAEKGHAHDVRVGRAGGRWGAWGCLCARPRPARRRCRSCSWPGPGDGYLWSWSTMNGCVWRTELGALGDAYVGHALSAARSTYLNRSAKKPTAGSCSCGHRGLISTSTPHIDARVDADREGLRARRALYVIARVERWRRPWHHRQRRAGRGSLDSRSP